MRGRLIPLALLLASPLPLSSGLQPTLRFAMRPTLRARPLLRACTLSMKAVHRPETQEHSTFSLEVDLGEGSGTVHEALPPLFTRSDLLTVRLQLPFSLPAEPSQGVLRVTTDGHGLHRGDVVRAFTTYRTRPTNPLFGALTVKPGALARCLFVADGQPAPKVIDALLANTKERTTDALLYVEREHESSWAWHGSAHTEQQHRRSLS